MILLSIVIPIYNEEKYLKIFLTGLLRKLSKLGWDYELILSENGSTDKTKFIAKQLVEKYQKLKLISLAKPNYGLAIKKGFLKARGKYLVLFDLDYYHVGFLKKAIKKMDTFDAVVASKLHKSTIDSRPVGRRIVTFGFSMLLKFLFAIKISDTHGMKVLNRKKFLPLIKRCCFSNEIFDTELLIRGQGDNLRLAEIGINVKEKRTSRKSILKRVIKTVKDLMVLKIKLLSETLDINKCWRYVWLIIGTLFALIIGVEIINISRTDAVIGEVHHQRQRQIEIGMKPFTGFGGRLTANKYTVAVSEITKRVLETVDLNIIFFAGHPNERAGIKEGERIPWIVMPFLIWGVITVVTSNNGLLKRLIVITLIISVMWAVRFEKITNTALLGVFAWVCGVTFLGFYNLVKKVFK